MAANLSNAMSLPVQVSGALLQGVIMVLITYFLLSGQTTQEELKERQVKVFEKKQEVYHDFLKTLHKIVQDGEITIRQNPDGTLNKSVDELKDLIFQFGYLQMHSKQTTIDVTLKCIAEIVKEMTYFEGLKGEVQQDNMVSFYYTLSEEVSTIVMKLKQDLYDNNIPCKLPKEYIEKIIKGCNLYVDADKYKIFRKLVESIVKEFTGMGYSYIDDKPITIKTDEVERNWDKENLRRSERNHVELDFEMHLEHGEIVLRLQIFKWGIRYGVPNGDNKFAHTLRECLQAAGFDDKNDYWCSYKQWWHAFDFDDHKNEGFCKLRYTRTHEQYVSYMAQEMNVFIKEFQKIAKEKGL